MSDHDDDLDVDQEDDSPVIKRLRADRRDLRQQVKDLTERAAAGDSATRRLAFIEAGLDLADPKVSYFAKAYEGELDSESIKAQAIKDGFLEAEEKPDENAEPDDRAALGRVLDASANGQPPGKPPSLAQQIADLEAAGKWTEAGRLKRQLAASRNG